MNQRLSAKTRRGEMRWKKEGKKSGRFFFTTFFYFNPKLKIKELCFTSF